MTLYNAFQSIKKCNDHYPCVILRESIGSYSIAVTQECIDYQFKKNPDKVIAIKEEGTIEKEFDIQGNRKRSFLVAGKINVVK